MGVADGRTQAKRSWHPPWRRRCDPGSVSFRTSILNRAAPLLRRVRRRLRLAAEIAALRTELAEAHVRIDRLARSVPTGTGLGDEDDVAARDSPAEVDP